MGCCVEDGTAHGRRREERRMSYTMTFEAGHKVGRGGHAKAFFRHIARDVDKEAGFLFPQANPNIVPERTALNFTLVNDGAGGLRKPQSVDGRPPSDEFDDYLKERLSVVGRALRKDAVLMRGVILQLDPKWFEEHDPDWREKGPNREALGYMGTALEWASKEFGQKNIVGVSMHLDELHPQLQLALTPVTNDGRLSQKDFFKGPSDLKRQHKELREVMASAGYDVEHRVTERSREHLSSSEFQKKANWLRDAAREMEDDQSANESMRRSLVSRASDLNDRESAVNERESEAVALRVAALKSEQVALEAQRRAQIARRAAEQAQERAESERERLRKVNARLESVPAYVDRWLDRTIANGQPLRKRFETDLKRMRAEVKAMGESVPAVAPTGRGEAQL